MTNDDYLWDGTGEPDAETRELEHALSAHRWRADAPPPAWVFRMRGEDFDGTRRGAASAAGRRFRTWTALAAAAVLLVGAGLGLRAAWTRAPGSGSRGAAYRLVALEGRPTVQGAPLAGGAGEASLAPGQRLVCDAGARAELEVGAIGRVELGPGTALRVEAPDEAARAAGAEYLLYLERGTMSASIFAAPRVFQVGTPSGIAVDLGCVYTAEVDAEGVTWLRVDAGLVAFETSARRITVPAGASARAWPGRGPGTPVWDAKPAAWRTAVEHLDAGAGFDEPDLALVLATEDPADSLTLWHLLAHPSAELRGRVFDRLAALVPPPADVTRAACLAREPDALERWRDELDWSW